MPRTIQTYRFEKVITLNDPNHPVAKDADRREVLRNRSNGFMHDIFLQFGEKVGIGFGPDYYQGPRDMNRYRGGARFIAVEIQENIAFTIDRSIINITLNVSENDVGDCGDPNDIILVIEDLGFTAQYPAEQHN